MHHHNHLEISMYLVMALRGFGPLGFQPNVAEPPYSPLWRVNNVEWKQGVSPTELKSEADILSAQN